MATKSRKATSAPPQVPPPPIPVLSPDSVTSATEWRSGSKDGFVVELPSGKKARLKRTMNLMSLLEKGKIPNPLAGRIKEMIASQKAAPDIMGDDAEEVLPQLLALVATQVKRIFVEPRIETEPEDWDEEDDGEWEPSEGAIALDDVDMQDRMFAFAFAQGMALDLTAFRQQQAQAVADLQDVSRVAGKAKQSASPDGPVPGVVPGRGDVDVRKQRGTSDVPGGSGAGEGSGEGSRENESVEAGAG